MCLWVSCIYNMCKYSDGNILNIPTIKIDARPEMSFMYKYRVNVKDCHPSHLLMYEIRFVGRAGFIKRSFPYEAEGSVCNLCSMHASSLYNKKFAEALIMMYVMMFMDHRKKVQVST